MHLKYVLERVSLPYSFLQLGNTKNVCHLWPPCVCLFHVGVLQHKLDPELQECWY